MDLDPSSIDLAALAWLAGAAANQHVLASVHAGGHPDLRIAHGYVFQHLIDGQPTIGELADALGFTQQAASKSVTELEGLGYVERVVEPGDSRVRRVRLTPRGQDAVRASRLARHVLHRRLATAAGEERVEAARVALVELLDLSGGTTAVNRRSVRPPG